MDPILAGAPSVIIKASSDKLKLLTAGKIALRMSFLVVLSMIQIR